MRTSESLKELMGAFMIAQTDIKNLSPNKQGYGYKYVDLAKILDVTKPILLRCNLLIIQSVSMADSGVGITTRLQHLSGEWMEDTFILPAVNQKSMNDVQGLGASITYGRRYGISCFLGIATDEDVDANMEMKPDKQTFDKNVAIKFIDKMMNDMGYDDKFQVAIMAKYKNAKTREDFVAIQKEVKEGHQ